MGKNILSIVLLNADARLLTSREVAHAASQAYGETFGEGVLQKGVQPEGNVVLSTKERPGQFLVAQPGVGLLVISHDKPYVPDKGLAAEKIRDFRSKVAVQKHAGWISVDWLGDLPPDGPELAYQFIGPLVAEFASDKTLAIYCTSTNEMNAFHPELLGALRGPTPLEAFGISHDVPIVHVDADDTAMAAAVDEARRRWSEFAAAFAKRRPTQGFAVKVPFGDDSNREFMWVEVHSIDNKTIRGKLVSEPRSVPRLKLNDAVTVSLDDLNDWIYDAGGEMAGGFTAKVLEQRQAAASPPTRQPPPPPAGGPSTAPAAGTAPDDRVARIRNLLALHDTGSLAGSMGQLLAGAAFCLGVGFFLTSLIWFMLYMSAGDSYIGWTGWFGVYLLIIVPLLIWLDRRKQPDYMSLAAADVSFDPSSGGEYAMESLRMQAAGFATLLTWGPRSLLDGWNGIRGRWSIHKHRAFDRAAQIVADLSTRGSGVPAKSLLRASEDMQVYLAAIRWLDRNDWIGKSSDGEKVWISSVAQKKLVSNGLWSPVQVGQPLRR